MPRPERRLVLDSAAAVFAQQLGHLRDEAGLTYRELAECAPYSHVELNRAANGIKMPTWPVTEAFIKACGVGRCPATSGSWYGCERRS
jgi:hypothetical protein